MSLGASSIDKAIKELNTCKKELQAKAERLVHLLTEQGVSLAQMNADFMSIYDTGALVRGIVSRYEGKVGFVSSTAAHSCFCEFGTGVMGQRNPHPDVALLGWRYDVNGHGDLGWWYTGADGQSHWTKGMPSRPYMYETAKMLEKFVVPLAREAFK